MVFKWIQGPSKSNAKYNVSLETPFLFCQNHQLGGGEVGLLIPTSKLDTRPQPTKGATSPS